MRENLEGTLEECCTSLERMQRTAIAVHDKSVAEQAALEGLVRPDDVLALRRAANASLASQMAAWEASLHALGLLDSETGRAGGSTLLHVWLKTGEQAEKHARVCLHALQ